VRPSTALQAITTHPPACLCSPRHPRLPTGAPVHCLAGNHDFGMAAFLGCLPPNELDLDATKRPEYTTDLANPKGFWPHPVEGGMHYQGRRWAEGLVFPSVPTFRSYGVSELELEIETRCAPIGR